MKFSLPVLLAAFAALPAVAFAGCLDETYDAHVSAVDAAWEDPEVLITIGQTCNGYTPPGIPDGMGALRIGNQVRLFVNHELRSGVGYEYGECFCP